MLEVVVRLGVQQTKQRRTIIMNFHIEMWESLQWFTEKVPDYKNLDIDFEFLNVYVLCNMHVNTCTLINNLHK